MQDGLNGHVLRSELDTYDDRTQSLLPKVYYFCQSASHKHNILVHLTYTDHRNIGN